MLMYIVKINHLIYIYEFCLNLKLSNMRIYLKFAVLFQLFYTQFQWSIMTSEFTDFKKEDQEFEQGQLQFNHLDPAPLTCGSGSNRGQEPKLISFNGKKNYSACNRQTNFQKSPVNDQAQTSETLRNENIGDKRSPNLLNEQKKQFPQQLLNSYQGIGQNNQISVFAARLRTASQSENQFYLSEKNINNNNKNKLSTIQKSLQMPKNQYPSSGKLKINAYQSAPYFLKQKSFSGKLFLQPSLSRQQEQRVSNIKKNILPSDPKKVQFLYQQNINISENNKKKQNQKLESKKVKMMIKSQIQKHSKYFRPRDWQKLLFYIQQIILENNNGVKHLWKFMDSFKEGKRFKKGKCIFDILQRFGLQEVYDKLIEEQQKDKKQRINKRSQIKSLIFNLVHRID